MCRYYWYTVNLTSVKRGSPGRDAREFPHICVMEFPVPNGSAVAAYAVNGLILVAVLGLAYWRLRRMLGTRRLRVDQLWVFPAGIAVVASGALVQTPPHGAQWLWPVLATPIGALAGWYRGRLIRISVDAETQTLNSHGSPAALILLVGLIALRIALKSVLIGEAQKWHIDAAVITDAFLFFALAMFGVQRLEMAMRARRLLAPARAPA